MLISSIGLSPSGRLHKMTTFIWSVLASLLAKDRSHVKPKLTWKQKLLRLFLVLGFVGALILLWKAYNSDLLRVQEVKVRGVSHLTESYVIQRSGILGANILTLNTSEVEARLRDIPYVDTAKVSRGLSNRVYIDIVERQPAIVWVSSGSKFLVDSSGKVLEEVSATPRMPLLEANTKGDVHPGSTLDPKLVASTLTLFSGLPEDIRASVEKVKYTPGVGYEVISSAGWTAVVGDDDRLEAKVAILSKILTLGDVSFIDVSTPATPYYRLRKS